MTILSRLNRTLMVKKRKKSKLADDLNATPLRGAEMDELLERLKLEAEEEKRRVYLERFGSLPEKKDTNRILKDFN